MRRTNFTVVTGVVTVLTAVCAARVAFQSQIPPPNPDIARWGQGEFVARAEAQDVAWRPLGPEAFREAQQLSRPIVIAIGVPWSEVGRQADEAFTTPEVARVLNRGFIPIRIDGAQDPRWISQFLPLQRARSGFSVGFQAWIFDLRGRLIDFVGRVDSQEVLDGSSVVAALVRAQSRFADAALSDTVPGLQATQLLDSAELLDPGVSDLSLANAARTLVQAIDPAWGGWEIRGRFAPRPLAVRFLQLSGESEGAGHALRQILLSPNADWLDGGVYRIALRKTRVPEYDKATVANAQFAEALAVQDTISPDPMLRKAAERTVAWLLSMRGDGLLPAAEQGDEDGQGRSHHASFSPRRLREAVANGGLPNRIRDLAQSRLGLDGSRSGVRVILPTSAAVAEDPRLDEVLAALRRIAGPPRRRVAPGLADVNGSAAACLLRCARLWDDRKLADKGGALVDLLEPFHTEDGVRHALTFDSETGFYLGDALAYADAAFEDFLTNGRVPSLDRGAAVLRQALEKFGKAEPGVLRVGEPSFPLMPGIATVPQVTDDEREACSAVALRLCGSYAAALGNGGKDFLRMAVEIDTRLGAVAEAVPSMGGSLGALARQLDGRTAFVVGEDALPRASRLARRLPNRLIIPVLGSARPELQGRKPGIYLRTATGCAGPFSEATALERLPASLQVGM